MKSFLAVLAVLVALQATESAAGRVRRGVSEEAESAYISQVATNLNTLCEGSDGKRVPPEYCNCDNAPGKKTTGPYDLGDVFNLIFELFGCGPGDCKCPGVEEMVDSRPEQLKTILSACPKDKAGVSMIEKGKCGNKDQELEWPIDIKKLFFVCQPKSFKCKGNDDFTPFTGFGCATGGFPKCKGKNWNSLKCSDGKVVGYAEAIKARLGDGCICEDGVAPKCLEGDNQYPVCPDGSEIDLSVGTPGHLWDACKFEES